MPEITLVRSCYAAWGADEIGRVLDMAHDDAAYRIHVPRQVLPFAGNHLGKPAIRRCLETIKRDFHFLAFGVDWIRANEDTIRARIVYYYRHEPTGEQLEANFRHVWRVDGGKVRSLDEFHDVVMLRAFLDMVRSLEDRK